MIKLGRLSFATVAALVAAQACSTRAARTDSTTANADSAKSTPAAAAHEISYEGDFKGPLGVQLWSFRDLAKTDPVAMMDTVRRMGFTSVETAGLYGMPIARFAAALQKAGLHATSMHVEYDDLKNLSLIHI